MSRPPQIKGMIPWWQNVYAQPDTAVPIKIISQGDVVIDGIFWKIDITHIHHAMRIEPIGHGMLWP